MKSKFIKNLKKTTIWKKDKEIPGYSYEEFIKKNLEKRHFIGAMLLKVSKKYFLFDVDRRELKYYRFNAFLSELKSPCKTIAEAYNQLIPQKVKNAIKKGLLVPRQGEWFFIPAKMPKPVKADEKSKEIIKTEPEPEIYDLPFSRYDRERGTFKIKEEDIQKYPDKINKEYLESYENRLHDYHLYCAKYVRALRIVHREDPNKYAIQGELRTQNNRPNDVDKYVSLPEGVFVKGEVTHSAREHEPLTLKDWHTAVPNTAVNSFTIEGNID